MNRTNNPKGSRLYTKRPKEEESSENSGKEEEEENEAEEEEEEAPLVEPPEEMFSIEHFQTKLVNEKDNKETVSVATVEAPPGELLENQETLSGQDDILHSPRTRKILDLNCPDDVTTDDIVNLVEPDEEERRQAFVSDAIPSMKQELKNWWITERPEIPDTIDPEDIIDLTGL